MALMVPSAFAVAGLCLEYGAILRSPRSLTVAELVGSVPFAALSALQASMPFVQFSGILLLPAAAAGAVSESAAQGGIFDRPEREFRLRISR